MTTENRRVIADYEEKQWHGGTILYEEDYPNIDQNTVDKSTGKWLDTKGRTMLKVEVSKAADSSFVPTTPGGTGSDYSGIGDFMVAKLKMVGELYMDEDSDFTAVDGSVYYAVLPESYVGEHQVVGLSGLYNEISFKYPGLYAFVAEAPDGEFTKDEEKEVIAILASFRDE